MKSIILFLVFIFDRADHCFVWVGKNASIDERKNAMAYGHVCSFG